MKRLLLLLAILSLALVGCEPDTPTPLPDDGDEEPQPKPEPDPELPQNYVKYGDVVRELHSMCYIINDAQELGIQYAMAMTPAEGVATFDEIIEAEEYLFISLGEETLMNAIEKNGGRVDALGIASDDIVYMFVVKLGEFDIVDNAADHLNIISGEVVLSLDAVTNEITIKAHYVTVLGEVDVAATLPLEVKEGVVSD